MSDRDADIDTESGEIARLISYVVLFVVSAVLFAEAAGIPTSRFEVLGAGAFPLFVHGGLMALLAGAILATVRRLPRAAYGRFGAAARDWVVSRRLVFFVFLSLGIYLAVMPVVGFGWATFVFLAVVQVVLGPKTRSGLAVALALSLAFSFGLNWIFANVFDVFLPRG